MLVIVFKATINYRRVITIKINCSVYSIDKSAVNKMMEKKMQTKEKETEQIIEQINKND